MGNFVEAFLTDEGTIVDGLDAEWVAALEEMFADLPYPYYVEMD